MPVSLMEITSPWKTPFKTAAAKGYKVSVVTKGGRVLAVANWGPPEMEHMALGHGWQEFTGEADTVRLLAWFAEGQDSGPIVYDSHTGDGMATVCLVKAPLSGVWLVIGERE